MSSTARRSAPYEKPKWLRPALLAPCSAGGLAGEKNWRGCDSCSPKMPAKILKGKVHLQCVQSVHQYCGSAWTQSASTCMVTTQQHACGMQGSAPAPGACCGQRSHRQGQGGSGKRTVCLFGEHGGDQWLLTAAHICCFCSIQAISCRALFPICTTRRRRVAFICKADARELFEALLEGRSSPLEVSHGKHATR